MMPDVPATPRKPVWTAALDRTRRWQVWLTWSALVVVMLSGALLRGMHAGGVEREPFMLVHSQHGAWSLLVLCLFLPSAVFVSLSRRDTQGQPSGRWFTRLVALLRLAAMFTHSAASLFLLAPLIHGVERAVALYALPLLLSALLLYGAADLVLAWRSPQRWPRFLAAAITSLSVGFWFAPVVIFSTLDFRSPDARAAGEAFLPLGLSLILLPATLLLLWEAWPTRRAPWQYEHNGRLSIIVVVTTTVLLVLSALALTVWSEPQDTRISESYVSLAAQHALFISPPLLWLFVSALQSIDRDLPRSTRVAVLVTLGLFVAALCTEVSLGLDGLPRRYAQHDEVFVPGYRVATAVWFGFVVSLLVTFATWPRRRRPISCDDFD